MGFSESKTAVVDHQGNVVIDRKCVVLLCPPSFETSKFIQAKPQNLNYRYISVGKLIRDQINKRTHYSKIIMDNLAKSKKINDSILQVLLKNVALQGNFIIQFCPKDADDLQIWKKFLNQVDVQLVIVIRPQHRTDVGQQKSIFEQKIKNYNQDVKDIKGIVDQKLIEYYQNGDDTWDLIYEKLSKNI